MITTIFPFNFKKNDMEVKVKVNEINISPKNVLLALLPVWDPLIPPVGISCLKCFLQPYGYRVSTIDANVESSLGNVKGEYFACLKKVIPEDKRLHINNIGHEVLKNHMMAHWHAENETDYRELVKTLVYQTFFTRLQDEAIVQLERIIEEFYRRLESYLMQLLDKETPDVLGLSVYSGTLAASLFAFKLAKERYPHITTVMGGGVFSGELALNSPNFTFFLKKTPYIDKIIVGEGELLLLKLMRGELPGWQRVYTLKDLNGQMLDISSLKPPDFSDFDLGYYVQMASYTSRSCPFQCAFCVETTYWGTFRKKSGRQIMEQLVQLFDRYHHRLFLMCDSLLNPVIADLTTHLIEADLPLYWGGYLRVDKHVCNPQNTSKWRQSGFYRARLGIESGSQRILDRMDKKIDIPQIKAAISGLANAGIKTTVMFVIGYPGETEADFQETLNLIEECREDIYEADCNPFWYYYDGQVKSDSWRGLEKNKSLYHESAKDMLLLQTWILDCEPSREETYHRVNRFIRHCKNLRIPDPYTLLETEHADERWKKLHKNAVPSLLEINSGKASIHELKQVKNIQIASVRSEDEGDWRF
jgi:radical SAM superfamily enzyme YgiQ (UPF0313 family)